MIQTLTGTTENNSEKEPKEESDTQVERREYAGEQGRKASELLEK